MKKITMKRFKEDLNGTLSYFGVYCMANKKPHTEDISCWFTNFEEKIPTGMLRKCVAKSNCLVFTKEDNTNSYLYFDQKGEKRSFYYTENDIYKLYLMESKNINGYLYMGYILEK